LYDGPFCVLSIVDNRTFKRLFYQVLDHDPSHPDMIAFFQRFQAILQARQLTVRGITTDGSPLYPATLLAVFGPVPHQICEFHMLKDLNQAVLRAVAQVRKQLAANQPKLKRGRPTADQRRLAQQRQRLQQKISDLFEYRHLFVQRHLTPAEQATLQSITRGFPQLRALREIVDEVYRLFDRRCRTATALAKLAQLRQRVRRFSTLCQVLKGLFSPNLEKALTFLDDRLLGATSNAVERGNRRYRKMQKTVYRVRTWEHIVNRLALDLFRDMAAHSRIAALNLLHIGRASP
jgi:Transposase